MCPRKTDGDLVYSTDRAIEKSCDRCRKKPCVCRNAVSLPPREQVITVSFERKGRGGKTVTLLRGFQLSRTDLEHLLKDLRKACGSGGTLREEQVELQGDHRDNAAAWLEQKGFRTRRSGG